MTEGSADREEFNDPEDTGQVAEPDSDTDAPKPPSGRPRRWLLLSAVIAMMLVLSLVAYLGGWFAARSGESTASPSAEVSAQDIEIDFDPDDARFYMASDSRPYFLYGDKYKFDLIDRQAPSEPVQFTDGVYYPKEGDSGDDPHMRFAEDTKPLYTDVNGDSNKDVVAVLEYTGDAKKKKHSAWKGVFIWLWKDGQAMPVEHMAAWQWMNCPAESDLLLQRDGLSGLPRVTRTGDGNCDGDKNDSQGENPSPQTVYVKDGIPVSVGHTTGAVDRCYFLDMYKKDANYTLTTEVTPRLAPDSAAGEVDGTVLTPKARGKVTPSDKKQRIDQIQLRIGPKPDKKLYDGWIPANIVWTGENQPITCGWVNWNDIAKKYKKEPA